MSDNYISKDEDVWSYDDDDAYSSVPSTSFVKSTVGAIEDEVGIIGDEIGGKQDGIWQQDTPPSSPVTNDLWLDTSYIPYKLMRWDGVEWIKATPTLPSDIGATTEAYVNQKVAEGVGSGIAINTVPPTSPTVDQLWIDISSTPNQLKRWDGSIWVPIDKSSFASLTGTISAGQISAGLITAGMIAGDTVTAAQIAAGAITANELAANAVTATHIAANTITTAMISAVGLNASVITAGTMSADRISGGSIYGITISGSTVSTAPDASNAYVKLQNQQIQFYYNGVQGGIISATNNSIGINATQTGGSISITTGSGGVNMQTPFINVTDFVNNVRINGSGSITINGSAVATQSYVTSQGYATQSYVTSQGYYSNGSSPTFYTIDGAGGFRVNTGGTINSVGTYNNTTGSSGNMFVSSGGLFYRFSSSIKYKEQVEDLWEAEYNKVLDLRPVWYKSKGKDDRKDWSYLGLIAEEVAEIEPKLVHFKDWYDEEGNPVPKDELEPEGVQYDRIGVMLIPIVRELKEKIRILEERLNGN